LLNDDPAGFWKPVYQKHLEELQNEAAQLSGTLWRYVQYTATRGREKRLGRKLGMEAGF